MALTDTFVRFAKASKPSGDKYYDAVGLYIHVKPRASTGGWAQKIGKDNVIGARQRQLPTSTSAPL
ncbi:Arm DNA-binding domain-containing protein [Duganella sp. HH101]|uniref:Arm DNA-binding domain-containing protein n=1 Tax=Duganella sp. HH101 TaxID=1781066 RepID=UPI000873D7D1|nr:Arm DNA-binding domain-containing protein [Duganella sp. HH101]OFA04406.1 hypothetical protein DUGA2_19510 [Duganella sp. HH101]